MSGVILTTLTTLTSAVRRAPLLLRHHPVVSACLLLTSAAVIVRAGSREHTLKSLVYLAAMLACVWVIDLIVAIREEKRADVSVRSPGRESLVIVAGTAVGFGALWINKMHPEWVAASVAARVGLGLVALGFVFPLVSSGYLLLSGYKIRDIGFAWQGLRDVIWFVPPLMLLTGGAALLVDPQGVTFARGVEEFGSWHSLLFGIFLTAALPEELSRVLLQSRVGALTTRARGWFIASLIWGLLHVPVWAAGTGDVTGAMWGAIRVVPLGLMWGYVTHRTGNIWTAWVLHATNLWGLQNF